MKMKIGIVRGLMPRGAQAEFVGSFNNLKPQFITGGVGVKGEISKYCKQNKIDHVDLPLSNLYGVDLVTSFFGGLRHQSWVSPSFDDLLKATRGLDVLETYEMYHLFSGVAADVCRELEIPLVVEVWTSFRHPAYFVPPYSIATKKVMDTASLFIARSEMAALVLGKMGVDSEKIKVIYHGANLKRFKRRKESGERKILKVLYVGAVTEEKGIGLLLDAWPQVHNKYPHIRLQIVGDGALRERAKKTNGVEVIGWIPHNEVAKIYMNADIFVSLYQNRYIGPVLWSEEFFSYTLMEAQASGLPCIVTDSGGQKEEVGKNNFVISRNDPESFTKALETLIENKKLRDKIGKGNRKRALKYFDLGKQVGILEKNILKLL